MFFGEPGPWFNKLNMDGDKTSVFHDVDGSVSQYPGSYLIKEDNWLIKHPDCIDVPDWRGSICSGHYAQVHYNAVFAFERGVEKRWIFWYVKSLGIIEFELMSSEVSEFHALFRML